MPTGYTESISKEISFKEFVLKCSRAFGALIEMRDEPMDAPIPKEFKPSEYHLKAMREAARELERYNAMTEIEAGKECEKEYKQAVRYEASSAKKNDELRQKYEAMLIQVKSWTPPTSEHQGLKDFMIEQISSSIKFDCSHTPEHYKPKQKTAQRWLKEKIEGARKNIVYHKKEYDAEVQRCKERTDWVNQLIKSLN